MFPQKQKSPWRWLSFLPGVILAMIVLVGCHGLTTSPNPAVVSATLTAEVTSTKTPEQRQLEETVWLLQSINGEPALPDVEVILEFFVDTHTFRGSTGCNQYGGPYEIKEQKFDIIEVEMSARNCLQEDLMEQERRYEDLLWNVTIYAIENGTLMLKTDSGETLAFLPQQ